jgi:hypothetical protein
MPVRARITFGVVAALLAVTAVYAYAADNVPKMISSSATPVRFCAKPSDACSRTGTTIHFRISTPAKVIADARPRKSNIWGFKLFVRRFPGGRNSVRINDSRFTTGRWTIKLQGVNSVGAGGPANIDVQVIK